MKTHILKILVILSITVISCNEESNNSFDEQSKEKSTQKTKNTNENIEVIDVNNLKELPEFLKPYKFTSLPIIMKGCFGKSYSLPLINSDDLECDNEDGTLSYCYFNTNGDFFAVIRIGLADCAQPTLITYDKNGNQIDKAYLGIGHCEWGLGIQCEEFTIINDDFSIYSSDTITEAKIDSSGKIIESTIESYVIYKNGKLLNTGEIELSDTFRVSLQ